MSKVGQDIIAALDEAIAHGQGEDVGAREHTVHIPEDIDVKAVRKSLNMTQQMFASRFGFPLGSVRNWEQGRRSPDGAARAFLHVIAREPEAVQRALQV